MLAIDELRGAVATDPGANRSVLWPSIRFPSSKVGDVTFVYRGPAHHVFLQHWIRALPQQQGFQRLSNTDLWYLTLDLPRNSRIEYKLGVEQGGPMGMHGHGQHARLLRDVLNPHQALDPFGANSVVHTEGYRVPDWTQPQPDARCGEIQEHSVHSAAFGEPRALEVYLPARYRPQRRYPATDRARWCRLPAVRQLEGDTRQSDPSPGDPAGGLRVDDVSQPHGGVSWRRAAQQVHRRRCAAVHDGALLAARRPRHPRPGRCELRRDRGALHGVAISRALQPVVP